LIVIRVGEAPQVTLFSPFWPQINVCRRRL